MKVKQVWKPKNFNGVVDRVGIKRNHFPRGQSNLERPITLNRMSPPKNNMIFDGLNKPKDQVSFVLEEVKKLTHFAKRFSNFSKSHAYGEGECSTSR